MKTLPQTYREMRGSVRGRVFYRIGIAPQLWLISDLPLERDRRPGKPPIDAYALDIAGLWWSLRWRGGVLYARTVKAPQHYHLEGLAKPKELKRQARDALLAAGHTETVPVYSRL